MKNKTLCFTGHRKILQSEELLIDLRHTLIQFINQGYRYFGAGGALGFDTIAAETVLSLKAEFPHIRLILVLPCPSQASRWNDADKNKYEEIKKLADKVVYTSEHDGRGCMHKRNRHLVDHSSVCICYLTQSSGGTFYTVNYAKQHSVRVINIADSPTL